MSDTIDKAEKLGRRRARLLLVLGVMLLAMQATQAISPPHVGAHLRAVDIVGLAGWTVLTLAVLFALITGGGLGYGAKVRAMVNDESTMANRNQALRLGFVVMTLAGTALYAAAFVEPLDGRMACHLVVSLGLATALIRFGLLERRAHAL